ncbi:hypothetical protein [Sanguibacter sp. Leaf3]|uniref:hypothetical protein n=1 Tax=Sanguibacter sp. Leaf3 TaxID=1736209 RepID=UPI000B0EFE4B|nr:hypothetical protein [Sanguibacter sp. Leaf3]
MKRPVAGVVLATVLVLMGSGCVAALPDDAPTPIETLSMEEPTDVQRTVETTGEHGLALTGRPPAAVAPVEAEEAAAQPEQVPAPVPVTEEAAPVATGALTIPSLNGWSESVVEEVAFVEGGTLKPEGRRLAVVTRLPEPWSAGQLLLIHSGGADENPGNALVERDGASTIDVGTEVVLPDGGSGVVTYSEVSPKSALPQELWDALAEGGTVLVTCRPETGLDSSTSNAVTIVQRTA